MMPDIDIFVLPTLTAITNVFSKFEKYYNQEKIPIPEDVARVFFLRQSILSYLIFSNAFGYKSIIGPPELAKVLKELEDLHLKLLEEEIKIYKMRYTAPTKHIA